MTTLNMNMVLNKPTFKHMQGLIPVLNMGIFGRVLNMVHNTAVIPANCTGIM